MSYHLNQRISGNALPKEKSKIFAVILTEPKVTKIVWLGQYANILSQNYTAVPVRDLET